jgi:hypothetical protein
VAGIGLPGDPTVVNAWDIGTIDGSGTLNPTHSVLSSTATPAGIGGGCTGSGYSNDGTNQIHAITYGLDPISGNATDDGWMQFAAEYDLHLQIIQQRTYFRFRPSAVISVDLPANVMGDYHLAAGSPAQDLGVNNARTPRKDIDDQTRPTIASGNPVDTGADQLTTTFSRVGGP